jgi:hypothetical protein
MLALPPAVDTALARRILGEALLLGVTADALLRPSLVGLALPLWIALVCTTVVAISWSAGRRIPAETGAWLATAVLFAATVAWRNAGLLQLAGIVVVLGSFVMAAVSMRDQRATFLVARLRDLLWAARNVVVGALGGIVPLATREALALTGGARVVTGASAWTRAAAIALALLIAFGSLLRGADPIFASFIPTPDVDVGTIASHLMLTGAVAWIIGGCVRAALDTRDLAPVPTTPSLLLDRLEVTAALGTLNVLFGVFVVAQAGWFFGGERFLSERTGLTAASYARTGFFQMVWVVLLLIPVLLATRAMLGDDRSLHRHHTCLALPLLGLLGLMVASAASRLSLYVHFYGLTTERLYPLIFLGWLGVVLAWFAWTVLRGRGDRFVSGALLSGLLILFAANLAVPDLIVARVNLARAASAPTDTARALDFVHLTTLSGEATPLAVRAVLAAPRVVTDDGRCRAAIELLRRWGPTSLSASAASKEGAWRRWNRGEALAVRTVAEAAPALRAVARTGCAPLT